MKILVADKVHQAGIDALIAAGYDVDVKLDLSEAQLIDIIPAYDAIAVRSAVTVTRPIIEAGTNLKVIGRAGVGTDNIDKEAAADRGIEVVNTPAANVVSAAEQTFALMLACARNTCQANASMHEGRWDRAQYTGLELCGKTLGIIGFGKIGTLLAHRAKAFGMTVHAYDPYCDPDYVAQYGAILLPSLDELLQTSDVISVHLPKTPETTNMICDEQIAKMKDGVIILNVARGGICSEQALLDGLNSGKIWSVGIDVFDPEPPVDCCLAKSDRAVLTPHLGASTKEAQVRAGTQLADAIVDVLAKFS
ncbi:MAG: NAD(P)-binding domain-containing protein [Coriobacteriia bacterium]|nr:NAD(P)-binding domain-containing protein [Coriobacteriia bacterium]MCL2536816.1 NAD(P)-binding domain-containing protein [Coriobacteriia bacterium]